MLSYSLSLFQFLQLPLSQPQVSQCVKGASLVHKIGQIIVVAVIVHLGHLVEATAGSGTAKSASHTRHAASHASHAVVDDM